MPHRSGTPDDLMSIADASSAVGLSVRTLRLYANRGEIPCERGPSGHRIFRRIDVERMRDNRIGTRKVGSVVLYARVSSNRQAKDGDLDRQIERLRKYADKRKITCIAHDIASGLADKRMGLQTALAACAKPEVSELVVTHRDRLARFGTKSIEQLLSQTGVRPTIIGEDADLTPSVESELVRDMLAIVTSFSGRLYGALSPQASTVKMRAARPALTEALT